MPLSKGRMRARKRKDREVVKPKSNLKGKESVQPVIPKTKIFDSKTFGYATKDVPGPAWME